MAERFGRETGTGDAGARSVGTTGEPTTTRDVDDRDGRFVEEPRTRVVERERDHDRGDGGLDAGTMRAARARQREEFGGINWGAAFFGWLVAVGLGALLTGILTAAGASLAIGNEVDGAAADTISLIGAIALVAVLMLAYFAGGYVAGRMSRFDGARQGFAAWAIGIIIAIALAVAGAILGSEYNVLSQLNLPRIPIDEGSLKIGGIIALAAAILLPLLASILGGKAGERYHKKVDRVAIDH